MTISPDGLFQYGGMPVTSGRYEGMWGNKTYFVDYDNGLAGNSGERPDDACKHLQTIIDKAGEWDTIYIRPRDPDTASGDPQAIIPASTTNWSISYGKHGLSLIGTGLGVGMRKANMTRLQASSTAQAVATMTSYAPYVNFENLTFRRGSGTKAGLLIEGQLTGSTSTGFAFNNTVNNCGFWKIGATATAAALYLESSWHNLIYNSWFEECAKGIGIGVQGSSVVGINVIGCVFNGIATTIDADIYATSGSTITEVLIDRCIFAHDIPALSSGQLYTNYIYFSTASGMFSNSVIGSETNTIATNCTLSNVDVANVTYAPGTNFTS